MRDPPNATAVSEGDVCHGEPTSDRPGAACRVPWPLRAQSLGDDRTQTREAVAESFAERFGTVLLRALAAWPT
jgi:hypothetical protein